MIGGSDGASVDDGGSGSGGSGIVVFCAQDSGQLCFTYQYSAHRYGVPYSRHHSSSTKGGDGVGADGGRDGGCRAQETGQSLRTYLSAHSRAKSSRSAQYSASVGGGANGGSTGDGGDGGRVHRTQQT